MNIIFEINMFKPTLKDGWQNCDCMSFSSVLQLHQNDERVAVKACMQWNDFRLQQESNPGLVDQQVGAYLNVHRYNSKLWVQLFKALLP